MGQAKQHGTLDFRVALAQERNKQLDGQLSKDNKPLQDFKKKHGTQGLATRLVMCGLLTSMSNIKQSTLVVND